MRINRSIDEGKWLFDLVLSRKDFDDICSGFPESGFIGGRYNEIYFHLFEGSSISDSWRPMEGGYFLNVGISTKTLPPYPNPDDVERYALDHYTNLEKAINDSGRIPIEEETVLFGEKKTVHLGYVVMKVEPLPRNG